MDDTIHMVPVPKSRLTQVYALLGEGPVKLTNSDESYDVPDAGGSWTLDELSRLHRKCNSTLVAIVGDVAQRTVGLGLRKSTQDTMIERGQPVYDNGEFTRAKLRAQLSWLSKHSRAIKGIKCWPIYVDRHSYYSMPKPLADGWLSFMTEGHVVDDFTE